MNWQRVVLGIGNPGAEYEGTRHNVGFMVLDRIAERLGLTFIRLGRRASDGTRLFGGKVKARIALGQNDGGEPFALVKPQTYVNLSGDVAGPLIAGGDLVPEALFVVVDDLNLPLGRIRVRPAGSSGGHNGLRSIEAALGSAAYPRLRLGIGVSQSTSSVDHVLAPFEQQERGVLGRSLERAADATCQWLEGAGLEVLMERFNPDLTEPPEPPEPTEPTEPTEPLES